MAQFGWTDCPPATRTQIDAFVSETCRLFRSNLLGIYLHGSLAMGCFNPDRSDVDLLVVTHKALDVETKRNLAVLLLRLSGSPHPIEISFVLKQALDDWQFPTPFDLHYSETWRDRFIVQLSSGEWQHWNDEIRSDPDLAAHLMIVNHRGVCLYGAAIAEVFPPIPADDYRSSIVADIAEAQTSIISDPVYTILNLCRVLWYVREGAICSKDEGGDWAVQYLPVNYQEMARHALALYRGRVANQSFDRDQRIAFAAYMLRQIEIAQEEFII